MSLHYELSQGDLNNIKAYYKIIMEDFNTKIRKGNEARMGIFGRGEINERSDDLVIFANVHNYKIMNAFQKSKRRTGHGEA